MKLPAYNNKLLTNVEGETQDFTIGESGVIIGLLRNNMYANKIGTPVQEIISNAKDACIEALRRQILRQCAGQVYQPGHFQGWVRQFRRPTHVSPDLSAMPT